MIGLVDLQLQTHTKSTLCPPNLEIMKLASYYKTEENTFCRLIGLDETELDGYDKIYVFSESPACIQVPAAFRRASNVIYGGTAFTNGVYIPFSESLIDFTLPRLDIYQQLLKDKYNEGFTTQAISQFLNNTYYRWRAGEAILPLPAIHKKKRFYIYDINFFQPGWQELITKVLSRTPSSINFIHPLHYQRITDFLWVRENHAIAKGNDAFLDLEIPLHETEALMKKYKTRLLATIQPSSKIYLSLGGSFYYKTDYYNDFIYKMNLLYIFWANGMPLKIKYEIPKLGCYDPLADLSKLVAIWTQRDAKDSKTIVERIPRDKSLSEIRPERTQIQLLLDYAPKSKQLFHKTMTSLKQGGVWRYELN